MEIKVKDIMTKSVISVDENSTVQQAAKKMKKIGSVLVRRGRKIYGIVTDSDIIKKVVAKGLNPKKVKIKEIASYPLIVINADESVQHASYLMRKHNIKRLPVVEGNKIVGIVSSTDIAKYIPDYIDFLSWKQEIKGKVKRPRFEELETETIGICEECGNIGTLKLIEGRWLCEFCEKSD
jgi:signal-transduction protein with cAMP-binding, CBS, and nucleotidyltransferase domain